MYDRFISNGSEIAYPGDNTPYKLDGKSIMALVDGKWELVKICDSWQETVDLLRELTKNYERE